MSEEVAIKTEEVISIEEIKPVEEVHTHTASAPSANIKFVGKTDEPFSVICHGMTEAIELPGADEQKRGFFHERASEITALHPHLYKPFAPKA